MHTKYLHLISAIFITTLIVSNIIAVKIGTFGSLFLPVAVVVFPVSYILADILTEVYGYSVMRRTIWTGFFCNLIAVVILWIARVIPPAPFYDGQAAFTAVFASTPRILAASFVAYLFGAFSNALILAKMKVKTEGKLLWIRMIVSTVIGEGLDSAIFITLAFAGVFSSTQVVTLAVTQWLFKLAFEFVALPISTTVVGALKRAEKLDHFDRGTDFHPLHF